MIPDRRGLIIKTIVAWIVGSLLGVALVFVKDFLAGAKKTDPEQFAIMVGLADEARRDLTRLWARTAGRLRLRRPR